MQKTPHRPWKDIASSIGEGISTHQCVYRWDTHLKLKNIAKDNDAPWTEEEVSLLFLSYFTISYMYQFY